MCIKKLYDKSKSAHFMQAFPQVCSYAREWLIYSEW